MSGRGNRVLARFYPESRLTGFARNDHRVVFYTIVNAFLKPHHRVLDFGAGRGKWADVETGFKQALTTLKGKCARIIGCDLDPAVGDNPLIDEAVLLEAGAPLPFENESFDLVTSWAVLEHIENPALIAAEIARILKPGGVFCAWTPNKWGYVGLGACLIPNRFHAGFVRKLDMGGRRDTDVFPTRYKLNTLGAVRKYFPASAFENMSFIHTGPPAYHGGSLMLARVWRVYNWLMPPAFGQCLYVVVQKK